MTSSAWVWINVTLHARFAYEPNKQVDVYIDLKET